MSQQRKQRIKDRILNARIPEDLDRELREQAEKLDMPVSQLVRGILQRTVDLVGNISDNVEVLVAEVVEDVAGFRDTVESVTPSGRRATLNQIVAWQPVRTARTTRCWSTGKEIGAGVEAWLGVRDDGRQGPCVAKDELDALLAGWRIDEGWMRIRLNRTTRCADTGAALELGAYAWLEKGSRPPVVISEAALNARRCAAEPSTVTGAVEASTNEDAPRDREEDAS
jgi:hypothetical protein